MKMTKRILPILSLVVGAFVLSAANVFAAVPSATSTLDTIMSSVIETTVGLVTTIFSTYWPYILIIGVISGLVAAFVKFTHIGTGKGR